MGEKTGEPFTDISKFFVVDIVIKIHIGLGRDPGPTSAM